MKTTPVWDKKRPKSIGKPKALTPAKKASAKAAAKKEDDLLNERLRRLRSLNMKLNNPNSLNELEAEPAFKRRNIQLSNTPYSSESDYSRYSLTESDDKRGGEIRKNNSFLHGNVD